MPFGTKRASEILGFHPKAVCLAIKQGRLRATRLGREYMILQEDLDAYMREHPKPAWFNRA